MAEPRYRSAPVRLEAYDPRWPERYAAEVRVLRTALGADLRATEHVGSTAIPGMPAKPVIDILADVDDRGEFRGVVRRLRGIGYVYDPAAEADDPARRVFRKGPDDMDRLRTHHLHVTEAGGHYWRRLVAFRDHLRHHPDAAEAYRSLKQQLVARLAHDSRAYTAAKHEFVTAIERQAGVGE